jgi:hypothetical protein
MINRPAPPVEVLPMQCCRKFIGVLLLLFGMIPAPGWAADQNEVDRVEIATRFEYRLGAADTASAARALALFGARYKAAALGAKYLGHQGLLAHYGQRQKEILCLAADEIKPLQLKEDFDENRRHYTVKATFEVTTTDFIQAEILNLTLGQQEKKWSYGEEMEQPVDAAVAPAREISRAYRYIRQKAFRIAIIYLHHLDRKYPNWGEVYLAKAIALYAIHSEDEMTAAFQSACALGNQEACEDLAGLTKTPE